MKIYVVIIEECCSYESKPKPIGVFLDKTKADELVAKKNTGDDWGKDSCWIEEMDEGVEVAEIPMMQSAITYVPQKRKRVNISVMKKSEVTDFMRGENHGQE